MTTCELNDRDVAAPATLCRDTIHHPPHYTFSAIEPIAVIEAWGLGFHLGCLVKYVCRAGRKGNKIEDLKKAQWYLDREIQRLEQEPRP